MTMAIDATSFNAVILGFSISTIIERIPTLCSGAECQSVDCASQTLAKAPEATPCHHRDLLDSTDDLFPHAIGSR